MNDRCSKAHCWVGIALSAVGDLGGTRVKISLLLDMKNAWLRAVE